MLAKEELKVGLLIWWNASRYMRSWSCPCVITFVDLEKNSFKVISFDDFEETDGLLISRSEGGDKSSLTEMFICKKDKAQKYLDNKKKELLSEKKELEKKISTIDKNLKLYDCSLEEVVKNIIQGSAKEISIN